MLFDRRRRFTCLALGWAVTLGSAGAVIATDPVEKADPFRPLFAEPLQLDAEPDARVEGEEAQALPLPAESFLDKAAPATEEAPVDDEFFPGADDAGKLPERVDVGPVPKIAVPVAPVEAAPVEMKPVSKPTSDTGNVAPVAAIQDDAEPVVEVIRERYDNRRIRIERQVIRDASFNYINHGEWTMWSPDGEKLAWGNYWQGKRQGRWVRWHVEVDGDKLRASTGTPATGQQTAPGSTAETVFEQPLRSEALFIEGKLTGSWLVSDARGRKVSSWEFHASQLNGTAIWWYPNGRKMREMNYSDGLLDGIWKEWSVDGELTRDDVYVAGRRKADFQKQFDSGEKMVEGSYLHPTDFMVANPDWWNGRLNFKVVKKAGEKLRNGRWTYWYANGGRQTEGEYVENRPEGIHRWWYPNGQLKVEGPYSRGQKQGQWVWYHANGQKMMEGAYFDGKPAGSWVTWDETGKFAGVRREGKEQAPRTAGVPTIIPPATTTEAPGARPLRAPTRWSLKPARDVRQR